MILRFIARLFQIAFAYLLAAAAAGATLSAVVATVFGGSLSAMELVVFGTMLGGFVGFSAAAPALVAILVGELFQLRSWVFYAVAGALISLGTWSLFDLPMLNDISVDFSWFDQTGLPRNFSQNLGEAFQKVFRGERALIAVSASGLVVGLVYWLAAGSSAGSVISVPEDDSHN
jgi:hypothetical protein